MASARLSAAKAADASLGSSNGLQTERKWRFAISQMQSKNPTLVNCGPACRPWTWCAGPVIPLRAGYRVSHDRMVLRVIPGSVAGTYPTPRRPNETGEAVLNSKALARPAAAARVTVLGRQGRSPLRVPWVADRSQPSPKERQNDRQDRDVDLEAFSNTCCAQLAVQRCLDIAGRILGGFQHVNPEMAGRVPFPQTAAEFWEWVIKRQDEVTPEAVRKHPRNGNSVPLRIVRELLDVPEGQAEGRRSAPVVLDGNPI